jgi:chemotaxis protein CheZ
MDDSQVNPNSDDLIQLVGLHAEALQVALQKGDLNAVVEQIKSINQGRDSVLYQEVGKLTRELHSAIRNFNIDTTNQILSEEQRSEMADAQDNLSYVIKLTQQSADKTMDMVEEAIPAMADIVDSSHKLSEEWHRFQNREMSKQDFTQLAKRIDAFLVKNGVEAKAMSERLNTILMAQDFQDLTGQVLKRVIDLVQEVESSLVHLMRIAGQVDQLTGQTHQFTSKSKEKTGIEAEGPIVNAESRENVMSSQDDVDDLLSSLGF